MEDRERKFWGIKMKRDEWTVRYTGAQLAEASAKKRGFHEERLKWWRDKKAEVIEKIKAEGITVTESIVDEITKAGYQNTVAARHGGPVVQIDEALQAHLREAQEKIQTHQRLISEHDSWNQMMLSAPAKDSSFELTQDDWMFFFGK